MRLVINQYSVLSSEIEQAIKNVCGKELKELASSLETENTSLKEVVVESQGLQVISAEREGIVVARIEQGWEKNIGEQP